MKSRCATQFLFLSVFVLFSSTTYSNSIQEVTQYQPCCMLDGLVGKMPPYVFTIINYLKNIESYKSMLPNAIMFYGPPGTGKTTVAEAIAQEVGAYFIKYSAANLVSKYQGSGPENVNELYLEAQEMKQRLDRPVIIFIDEIDSICKERSSLTNEAYMSTLNQLLIKISECKDDPYIFTIVASNKSDLVDAALHSRMIKVSFTLPDQQDRFAIISKYIDGISHNFSASFVKKIAQKTDNFSGRELEDVIRRAAAEAELAGICITEKSLWQYILERKKEKNKEVWAQKKEEERINSNRYFAQEAYAITTWAAALSILFRAGAELIYAPRLIQQVFNHTQPAY